MNFKRLFRLIFKTARDLSLRRSFLLYRSWPLKLLISRHTKITRFRGSIININGRLFIDCKNGGQFFYHSSLVLMENSKLTISGNVNFFSGLNLKLFEKSNVVIGNGTYFSGPVTIHSKESIHIGKNCAISWNVSIIDSNFHKLPGEEAIKTKPIQIGDFVWIGCNSVILPGSVIEYGAVIPAGSTVRGLVKAQTIYKGWCGAK